MTVLFARAVIFLCFRGAGEHSTIKKNLWKCSEEATLTAGDTGGAPTGLKRRIGEIKP